MNLLFKNSPMMKWYFLNRFTYSLLKKSTPFEMDPGIMNPFKNKSFIEMNRIMSSNLSQKNELVLCGLVLKTTI
jgi:hypothetical protein